MARRDELDAFLVMHHGRKRKRVRRQRRRRRAGVVLALFVGGILVFLPLVGFGAGAALTNSCSLTSLKPVNIGANSFVYAADGSLLGSIPAQRNREPVPLDRISPWLPKATVAVEDRRFYQHGGIDYVGIARALWADIGAGKVVEGGSTIDQQLVRNMYTGSEQTFDRKIKEACLAIKLADKWSKNRILSTYLNTVYYGNHAYGVEAAAETYFSKHARDLDLAQAALIAGLPQAPSIYDPLHNPKAATVRRAEVLKAMLVAKVITRREYRWAVHRTLRLKPGQIYTQIKQPYFFSYVIDELTSVYGANTVREGGLRVYTTIEPRLQADATRAIRDTLNEHGDPAAAIVSIQPGTGAIRAMTDVIPGDRNNQFNLAAQSSRQAGSTFKTFVLAAAIAKGIDPDTTYYMSAPFTCTTGPWCVDDYKAGKPWTVTTFGHDYAGEISITNATLRSDNTVYAQLTLDVGPDTVYRLASNMGVNLTGQKPVASIGLGSLTVSPLDMASAYATFAAGGIYAKPTAIRKVVLANGKVDTDANWGKPQTKRVLSQGVAWKVNQILGENALYGTGAGSSDGIHPNAGKTGTTQNFADAWFVGYTRDFSTAVWMGYPKGEIPMLDVHGEAVAGATFSVPMWHLFMAAAEAHLPARQFLTPNAQPVYKYFQKGYYGYLATTPATTTTTTTTTTPKVVKTTPTPAKPLTPLEVGVQLIH
jgi:penicillin-binding protein 1A